GLAWLAVLCGGTGAWAQPATLPTLGPAPVAAEAQPAQPPSVPAGQRPVPGFGADQTRMSRAGIPPTVGATPRPSSDVNAEYGRFVKQVVTPEATFDVIVGRTSLMVLKEVPRRVQIADETIAAYT